IRVAELLVQGVGLGGERFVGVVGVGDRAVFGVGRAEEQRADGGSGGVVEGASLCSGGARHGDRGEVVQDVIGVGGGQGAAGLVEGIGLEDAGEVAESVACELFPFAGGVGYLDGVAQVGVAGGAGSVGFGGADGASQAVVRVLLPVHGAAGSVGQLKSKIFGAPRFNWMQRQRPPWRQSFSSFLALVQDDLQFHVIPAQERDACLLSSPSSNDAFQLVISLD